MAAVWYKLMKIQQEEEEDLMKLVLVVRAMLDRKKRRKHRWWVHGLLQKRKEYGVFYHLVKELNLDAERFQQYFRLSREQFAQVLFGIGPYIEKRSRSREVIDTRQRLAVCLR